MSSRVERPFVVAVSPLEQQRETLALVLEPDFEVATFPFLRTPGVSERRPAVVVLSLVEWPDGILGLARRAWPTAELVLLDPPPQLQAHARGVEVASWEDPAALQWAVARALLRWFSGEGGRDLTSACGWLASLAQAEVGSVLLAARTMGALAASASSPSSRYVAARAFAEQLRRLEERLAWVDAVLACGQEAPSRADLIRALEEALGRWSLRFACRLLAVERAPARDFPLCATEEQAELAARCVISHLVRLQPGTIRIRVDRQGALVFEHPAIQPERESLALLAARAVFGRLHVALHVEDARIVLAPRGGCP